MFEKGKVFTHINNNFHWSAYVLCKFADHLHAQKQSWSSQSLIVQITTSDPHLYYTANRRRRCGLDLPHYSDLYSQCYSSQISRKSQASIIALLIAVIVLSTDIVTDPKYLRAVKVKLTAAVTYFWCLRSGEVVWMTAERAQFTAALQLQAWERLLYWIPHLHAWL